MRKVTVCGDDSLIRRKHSSKLRADSCEQLSGTCARLERLADRSADQEAKEGPPSHAKKRNVTQEPKRRQKTRDEIQKPAWHRPQGPPLAAQPRDVAQPTTSRTWGPPSREQPRHVDHQNVSRECQASPSRPSASRPPHRSSLCLPLSVKSRQGGAPVAATEYPKLPGGVSPFTWSSWLTWVPASTTSGSSLSLGRAAPEEVKN